MAPTSHEKADPVRFFIPPEHLPALRGLPWEQPLERWQGRRVPLLEVKSGVSRHDTVYGAFDDIICVVTSLLRGDQNGRETRDLT